MEPLAAASVTNSSDEVAVINVVSSSSPVNLQSSVSPLHSTSRLSDRRWSTPDDCGSGSDSVEASQQCRHSADAVSSKQLSDWETEQPGIASQQPATHLMYSDVPSHASPQHNILPVVCSFCFCLQHACCMLLNAAFKFVIMH